MPLSDEGNRWVGITNGQKCCNCYFYYSYCGNCLDDIALGDGTFKSGLMSYKEFSETTILNLSHISYREFDYLDRGNYNFSDSESDESESDESESDESDDSCTFRTNDFYSYIGCVDLPEPETDDSEPETDDSEPETDFE